MAGLKDLAGRLGNTIRSRAADINPLGPYLGPWISAWEGDPQRVADPTLYGPASPRYGDLVYGDSTGPMGPMGGGIDGERYTAESAAAYAQGQQQSAEQAKMDFLASLFGGTGSGSAGPSAAQIQAAIDKINEDYNRQLGSLVARRDQGANSIAAALGDFRSATAGNNNLYNMASQQISDGIAARLAQALADAQSSQQAGARQADALGWNGAAIQANAANNTQALTNSIRYQQDLADRYRQVQANSQNQTANAGELVNQGAVGRLAGGYQDAVNALEQSRSDAVYSARNPAGGGGGGGSSKAPSPRDYMAGLDLYDRMYGSSGSIDPTTAYMYQMFRQDPTGFASNDATKQYMPQIGQIEADRLNKQLGYYPQNYS